MCWKFWCLIKTTFEYKYKDLILFKKNFTSPGSSCGSPTASLWLCLQSPVVSLSPDPSCWPALHTSLVSAFLHTVTYTAHFLPSLPDPSSRLLPTSKICRTTVLQTRIFSVKLSNCRWSFFPSQQPIPGSSSSEFIFHYLDLGARQAMGSASFSSPQGRVAFLYLPRQDVNSWSPLCSTAGGRTERGEWKLLLPGQVFIDSLTTCAINICDYLHVFMGDRLWLFPHQ